MSTKFYIKDNNGEIFSENRKTRYRLIKGHELKEYITKQRWWTGLYVIFKSNATISIPFKWKELSYGEI